MSVTGLETVVGNLKLQIQELNGPKLDAAMYEFLVQVEGRSYLMTPVAIGNLLNSQYKEIQHLEGRTIGYVGYGADYALYVHNAPGTLKGLGISRSPARLGNYWDPTGEPRFLVKGAQEAYRQDFPSIIKRHMDL